MITNYFPPRLLPLVRSWREERGGLSLDDVYDLADYAGVTLEEVHAAIAHTNKDRTALEDWEDRNKQYQP
jgi:hypothetical protein